MYIAATAVLILTSLFMVSPGDCIKCHQCDTLFFPEKCQDDFNTTEFLIDCDMMQKKTGLHNNFTSCMKLKMKSPGPKGVQNELTLRGCAKASCDEFKRDFIPVNASVSFCGVCDSDGCNPGAPRRPSLAITGALPLATVLAFCRGFLSRNT